jgi:hypothetical protein
MDRIRRCDRVGRASWRRSLAAAARRIWTQWGVDALAAHGILTEPSSIGASSDLTEFDRAIWHGLRLGDVPNVRGRSPDPGRR